MNDMTTPKIVSHNILRLIKKLELSPEPMWIDVIAENGCSFNECFENVKKKTSKDGGRIVYGWQICEWENVMIEAVFHSIWRSPDNIFIDITPKPNGENKILFFKDNKRIFHGARIDDERFPLRNDKLIKDYMSLSKMFFQYMESGNHHDNPLITTIDGNQYNKLLSARIRLLEFIKSGANENTKCLCGKNRKYKNCCAL